MNFKSWKPEVLVDGTWTSNSLRFATEAEADASVRELLNRWFVPKDGRAVRSTDPVNYRFDFAEGRNVRLDPSLAGVEVA